MRLEDVTPGLRSDLEKYVCLLTQWQHAHNLISSTSLADVWTRHIADSLQLIELAPPFRRWADIGSGAGFPGLIVALFYKDRSDLMFTLIESNSKKCAFLRMAAAALGTQVDIMSERAETLAKRNLPAYDVVSARAVAPLRRLLQLAFPILAVDGTLLLLKGEGYALEHRDASLAWSYEMLDRPSRTDPSGRVLSLRGLRPKAVA